MKFKKGQKVRVKVWEDMPQYLSDTRGYAKCVGDIVTIQAYTLTPCDGYDVIFEDGSSGYYLWEELEPVIKVGEQLLFSFMNDVNSTQEE